MNESPPSDVAAWIASARKEKNLSQGRLAEEVGVSQPQISQWETGKSAPSEAQLAKLHGILGKPKARRAAAPPPSGQLSLDVTAPAARALEKAPAKASEPPPSPRKGPRSATKGSSAGSAAVLGFEEKLWEAAACAFG
jgi:transcriptional regulator with XRE-family HTH domain